MQTPGEILEYLSGFYAEEYILVEAGAHNGKDSEAFLNTGQISHAYLFEPDSDARAELIARVKKFEGKVSISKQALSDSMATKNFHYPKAFGTASGSSRLNDGSDYEFLSKVSTVRLDDFLEGNGTYQKKDLQRGIYWLDVEGHAYEALKGSTNFLNKCVLLKVEVEYTKNLPEWSHSNFFKIIVLLYFSGFRIYQSDLQPTSRGDVIFVRKELMRFRDVHVSVFAVALHTCVYPIKAFLSELLRKIRPRKS
jgi:FkbM family methyltransferase